MSSPCSLVGLTVLLFLLPLWAAEQEDQETAPDDHNIFSYNNNYQDL